MIGIEEEQKSVPSGYQWLVELAREAGVSDEVGLQSAVIGASEHKTTGVDYIIDAGVVKEDEFGEVLARKAKLEWLSGEFEAAEEDLKDALPAQVAVSQQVFPLSLEGLHCQSSCVKSIIIKSDYSICFSLLVLLAPCYCFCSCLGLKLD